MSNRNAVSRLALLSALAALAGCSTLSGSAPDPFAGPENEDVVRLYVQNDNFYDARLSTIIDGVRRQIGYVGGHQDAVFDFTYRFANTIRVEIDILAGPTCTTDPIEVDPGDTLQLQIMSATDSSFCRQGFPRG